MHLDGYWLIKCEPVLRGFFPGIMNDLERWWERGESKKFQITFKYADHNNYMQHTHIFTLMD